MQGAKIEPRQKRKPPSRTKARSGASSVKRSRATEASPPSNDTSPLVILEKDPAICLVYHVKDRRNRYIQKEEALQLYAAASRDAAAARKSNIRICADGDSWINILWPLSGLAGYQPTLYDFLEGWYYAPNVAYPGDTFEQMLVKKDFRSLVKSASFDFFIFSGGGNDVLGGGALTQLLRARSSGTPNDPGSFIRLDILDRTIRKLEDGYNEIARDVAILSSPKRTQLLVHGYDVPKPVQGGVWLGGPFTRRGFSLTQDITIIESILTYLVDRFYEMLERVEGAHDNTTVVHLKDVVGNRWNDELHPKRAASQDLAKKFSNVIDALSAVPVA
ncbi:hypothetical protein GOC07_30580 [Sinorhizobium meliloti]|nr:hypothetical protein [Sinorhizobium meliloti]